MQNIPTFVFQEDGSPAHFHCEVRQYLNTVLPRTLDRACVWKWPTTVAMAREVSWHYALWFFLWGYVKDRVFVPPLPRDLADLKTRIVASVKNIDAHLLTRVCGKNLNIVSMCAVSPVVHTWTSLVVPHTKKKLFQFSCGCEQFH
jgi:hypothetical protein